MENKENKVANSGSIVNFKVLEKFCKMIEKYALKELTIQPDGTITIVKEVHVAPQVKVPRKRKSKEEAPVTVPVIPNVDLALVAANLTNKADRIGKLNNFNRYQTGTVLPNQGKE